MKKTIIIVAVSLAMIYSCSKHGKGINSTDPAVNTANTIHIFPENLRVGVVSVKQNGTPSAINPNSSIAAVSDGNCYDDFINNFQMIYKGYAVKANAVTTNGKLWTQTDNAGTDRGYVSAYWQFDIPSYIHLNANSLAGAGAVITSDFQSVSISSYAQGGEVTLIKNYTDAGNGTLQMSRYSIRVDYVLTHQLYCGSLSFKASFRITTDCPDLGSIAAGASADTVRKRNPPPQPFVFSGTASNNNNYLKIGLPGFCTCMYCDQNYNSPLDYEVQYRYRANANWTDVILNPLTPAYDSATYFWGYTISVPVSGNYEVRARTHIAEGKYSAWYGAGDLNVNNILFGIDSSSMVKIP